MNAPVDASGIDALVREAWDAKASVRRVRPLAGDASTRTYFRLELAGGPLATAVLMVQPGSGLSISSEELTTVAAAPGGTPFLDVQRYLAGVGIPVPAVYAHAARDGEHHILLEDVGDTPLWEAATVADRRRGLYREAVDLLVALQRAGRDHPDTGCIAFRQRFDERLFRWELDHFLEYGFAGRRLADRDRERLDTIFDRFAAELGALPPVLAHRDFHGWNLFVAEGRIRVLDFQDALLAPPAYDLASLLTDRTTPSRLGPDDVDALVGHYLATAGDLAGPDADPERFRLLYHRLALQRAMKVVGRFVYLEDVKGKRGYRPMIPDALGTIARSLACLCGTRDMDELGDVLARSFPELAA